MSMVHLHDGIVSAWIERMSHHLITRSVFVGPRPCNVLIVIVLEVLLSDWALRHDRILQVIHHLVLRPRLDLKWTDAT